MVFPVYKEGSKPQYNLQAVHMYSLLMDWTDASRSTGGRIFKRGLILLPVVCIVALNLIEGVAKLCMAPVGLVIGPKGIALNRAQQAGFSLIFSFFMIGAFFVAKKR
jgi:hypothetical protein